MSQLAIDGLHSAPSVLHVPYTYFPDPCGGTEVYVRGLAQRLAARGFSSTIAAPGMSSALYEEAGLSVHRFGADPRPRLELAYGMPDDTAAAGFREIVTQIRPAIVHLHARTAAVSERIIDVAHDAGARVIFTYHTPTVSCARGTMMHNGTQPCDGLIETRRCTSCALSARGAPALLARLTAAAPAGLLRGMSAWSEGSRSLSRLRVPGFIASAGERFRGFIDKVDHVVAVCAWVRDVLLRNHVPATKITLSRQGISPHGRIERPERAQGSRPLRIAYFGRVDAAKGPDLLARALPLIPRTNVQIDIYAVRQSGSDPAVEWLEKRAQADVRLRVLPAVSPEAVVAAMTQYDLVAVPSRGLETGPLVVLEAFAAGVPVLGARLGGIAELVRHGTDGFLVPPDAPSIWAGEIARLAADVSSVARLRTGIRQPRTIEECADDMATLYRRVVDATSSSASTTSQSVS